MPVLDKIRFVTDVDWKFQQQQQQQQTVPLFSMMLKVFMELTRLRQNACIRILRQLLVRTLLVESRSHTGSPQLSECLRHSHTQLRVFLTAVESSTQALALCHTKTWDICATKSQQKAAKRFGQANGKLSLLSTFILSCNFLEPNKMNFFVLNQH